MPTKLARTVASSVSGWVSDRQTTTATAMTAPTRITVPTIRPSARRQPGGDISSTSSVGSATEDSQPDDDGDQDHETRIHEGSRAEIGVDAQPGEELPRHRCADDTDDEGRHPRWEVGSHHGDVGPRAAPCQDGAPGDCEQPQSSTIRAGTRAEPPGRLRSHATYRSVDRAADGTASPVLKASVTDASSNWTFVSTSWKRARLSSRRAASRSTRVPRPRR